MDSNLDAQHFAMVVARR